MHTLSISLPHLCPPLQTMFSILPPSFYSLFSQLTFLPKHHHALASPPPPPPTLNLQSLTTASVWPAGVTLLLHRTQATLSGCRRAYGGWRGWRGWGRESPLTQHHWPQPGRHGQRELVCQFQTLLLPPLGPSRLSIHPSSLSLPIKHPRLHLSSVCCHKYNTLRCCLRWIFPPGPFFFLFAIFPTWQQHTKALFTTNTNIH